MKRRGSIKWQMKEILKWSTRKLHLRTSLELNFPSFIPSLVAPNSDKIIFTHTANEHRSQLSDISLLDYILKVKVLSAGKHTLWLLHYCRLCGEIIMTHAGIKRQNLTVVVSWGGAHIFSLWILLVIILSINNCWLPDAVY